jgi:hypothetical protein
MNEEAERLKHDLQTIENALGVNLWTRRDVRRGLLGVLAGGCAGLFLAIWCAREHAPEPGLILFLAALVVINVAKGIGFNRQPAPAPGSCREVAFYNRFFSVGSVLICGFYIWGQNGGMDPLVAFASTIVMAGVWYIFYAISAPSRWISIGGAIALTACGFLLASAHSFSQALSWLGLATCVGCWAEAILLFVALRSPPSPPSSAASPHQGPNPASPNPMPSLAHAAD